MSLPTKHKRVNPIKLRRQADVSRAQPKTAYVTPCAGDVETKRPNWMVIAVVAVLAGYGVFTTYGMFDAKVDLAYAEGKAEAQADHIDYLESENTQHRETSSKRQAQFPGWIQQLLVLAGISSVVGLAVHPGVGGVLFVFGGLAVADVNGLIEVFA